MPASTRPLRNGTGPLPEGGPAATDDTVVQARLVAALAAVLGSGTAGRPATLIETHISRVLLTGRHAWKIKKPVDLGFLDFSTLAARRFYCEEELRLNRRLAPQLYLDVVAITGTIDAPVAGGDGPAIEYAVRMREFPQDALASNALARGELSPAQVNALAAGIAAFHRAAARAPAGGHPGAPEVIRDIALQNFSQLRHLQRDAQAAAHLDALRAWTRDAFARCAGTMAARRDAGFVRECHGDLHLGNIALLEGKPVIFDCIEFNDDMRWIDVMSEVAFTTMDLADRGRPDLAHRFLDAYLEATGDYAGLEVLRFYLVYRAMVRAKVTRMRAAQAGGEPDAGALGAEYRGYVRLAQSYAQAPRAAIILMHALSGSGKTVLSQALLEACGAVRIRTDVERKRLHGLDPAARGDAGVEADLYAPAQTQATYARVQALAQAATAAGFITIIDGTFLHGAQRRLFRDFATANAVPLIIVACGARESVLRERVAQRHAARSDASDADLAVLAHQVRTQEPLTAAERAIAVDVDTEAGIDAAAGAALWRTIEGRIAAMRANGGAVRRRPALPPMARER